MSAGAPTPLYRPVADHFEPTPYARGPWNPDLLHGGAVGAPVAELLQDTLGPSYQPARLTVDLLRPVPMAPLAAETTALRTGARLGAATCTLTASGKAVAAASLIGIRPQALSDEPPSPGQPAPDDPGRAENLWDLSEDTEAFIGGGMLFRFLRNGGTLAGGVVWLRLHRPVLPDRAASPLARVAAAADVPSAVAAIDGVRYPDVGFINADISVHLHRPPQGEWYALLRHRDGNPQGSAP